MEEEPRPFSTLGFVWNANSSLSPVESNCFLLNGVRCYLRLCSSFYPLRESYAKLNTEGKTHGFKKPFYVTTFVEDLAHLGDNDKNVDVVNVSTTLAKAASTTIWKGYPDRMKKTVSFSWRVTCVFYGDSTTSFSHKCETSLSSIPCEIMQPKTKSSSDKSVQVSPEIYELENLSFDLSKLLENEALPDVKLKSDEQIFSAHKAVLAARSEVFAAMFRNRMLESETGNVDIKDVETPVLELFLKYMYSGKIEVVPDGMTASLYEAGDKYAVPALKRACSERMIRNLTVEKCLDALILSDAHNDEKFKTSVVNFILENVEVLQSEAWSRLNEAQPKLSIEVYQKVMKRKIFNEKSSDSLQSDSLLSAYPVL